MEQTKHNILLEIRGLIRTLNDDYGQVIVSKKRAMELIEFLRGLEE